MDAIPVSITTLINPLDPRTLFPNLPNFMEFDNGPKSFIGVMQTSDLLGNPDNKIGNVDVLSSGGRLQPGCYSNSNNIHECNLKFSYPLIESKLF